MTNNASETRAEANNDLGNIEDDPRLAAAVRLVEAGLSEVRFKKLFGGTPADDEAIPIKWGLGAVRLGPRRFGVEFSVEFNDWKHAELYVSYRALFDVHEAVEEDQVNAAMRRGAASLGPIVLYPFLRHEVDGLLSQANLRADKLPVINVGAMFDPEVLDIDEIQEEIGL